MSTSKNVEFIWNHYRKFNIIFFLLFLFPISIFAQDISRIYYYKNILEDTTIQNQMRLNTQWDDYAPLPIFGEKFILFQSQRPGPYEEHSLWYSFNKNYHDPTSEPEWSDPLPLVFPLEGNPSKTMKVQNQEEFTINSDSFVGHPSVYIENNQIKEIYFTSTKSSLLEGYDRLNIYVAKYINHRWSNIEHLNEINSNFDDSMPFITNDGKKLFFVSNRPGGYGGYDIWYTERDLKTGKWSKPVNLGPTINSRYDEITPFLTINQQKLIFASNRPGGLGQFDLYVSNFNGLDFDPPLNLGEPFNSLQNDEALKISDNSLWTYFASDRIHLNSKGGYDLYRFLIPKELIEFYKIILKGKIINAETQEPVSVEATILIEFGLQNLVIKSDRRFKNDGKTIENTFQTELYSGRIYRLNITAPGFYPLETLLDYKDISTQTKIDERIFYLQPIKPIEPIIRYIPGIVIDEETNLPLPGSQILKIGSDDKIIELKLDSLAQFSVPVRKDEQFQIKATSPGYESKIETFKESKELEKIIIKLKKIKEPCEEKQPECIWNTRIFFDLDSAVIKPSEQEKLKLIAEILKKYPNLKIEIQGHTDLSYRGPKEKSYEYNLKLSIERANNVKKVLIELGIEESRLIIKGYSYTKPLVEVPDPIKGAINRRVEFKELQ